MPQEDLPLVYNLASLFVYPTIYEGFGLPALEAMACGVPVITSKVASLPEIVGDAGILIPVDDVDALHNAMRRILQDQDTPGKINPRWIGQIEIIFMEADCTINAPGLPISAGERLDTIRLSICIVTYNARDWLVGCLNSIQENTQLTSLEIIVVDNGSKDGIEELLSRDYPQVRFIGNNSNQGYTRPMNQGLTSCSWTISHAAQPGYQNPDRCDRKPDVLYGWKYADRYLRSEGVE